MNLYIVWANLRSRHNFVHIENSQKKENSAAGSGPQGKVFRLLLVPLLPYWHFIVDPTQVFCFPWSSRVFVWEVGKVFPECSMVCCPSGLSQSFSHLEFHFGLSYCKFRLFRHLSAFFFFVFSFYLLMLCELSLPLYLIKENPLFIFFVLFPGLHWASALEMLQCTDGLICSLDG